MTEIEVFVIVDSEGSYVSHVNLEDAHELANDQSLEPTRRVIQVVINVPVPEFISIEATLPEESKAVSVEVK